MEERRKELERHCWFNQEQPMVETKKTWKEKQIEKEEEHNDSDSRVDKGHGNVEINMVFQLPVKFHLLVWLDLCHTRF
jgi:hypothetical protein